MHLATCPYQLQGTRDMFAKWAGPRRRRGQGQKRRTQETLEQIQPSQPAAASLGTGVNLADALVDDSDHDELPQDLDVYTQADLSVEQEMPTAAEPAETPAFLPAASPSPVLATPPFQRGASLELTAISMAPSQVTHHVPRASVALPVASLPANPNAPMEAERAATDM